MDNQDSCPFITPQARDAQHFSFTTWPSKNRSFSLSRSVYCRCYFRCNCSMRFRSSIAPTGSIILNSSFLLRFLFLSLPIALPLFLLRLCFLPRLSFFLLSLGESLTSFFRHFQFPVVHLEDLRVHVREEEEEIVELLRRGGRRRGERRRERRRGRGKRFAKMLIKFHVEPIYCFDGGEKSSRFSTLIPEKLK